MRLMITPFLCSVLAVSAVAQGRTVTDLGTIATMGNAADSACVQAGTSIERRAAQVVAQVGTSRAASVAVSNGNAIQITELGVADSPSTAVLAAVGSSRSKAGPIGALHTIATPLAIRSGTRGVLTIRWQRHAVTPTGAAVLSVVNLNGRDVAAFDENTPSTQVQVALTVANNGLTIALSSGGLAAARDGVAAYHTTLTVQFDPVVPSPCTVRAFGSRCGVTLVGQTSGGSSVHRLDLTFGGTGPAVAQFLLVGSARTTPDPFPLGGCDRWVDPVSIIPLAANQRTLTLGFRPRSGLRASFQVVSVAFTSRGMRILTSNGLELGCP